MAIVDDTVQDAVRLEADLRRCAREPLALSCSHFGSGDALLAALSPGAYDLLFLDICMEGTDGIETARRVRQLDPKCLIVFVSSSGEYVWQSFSVHPFDYLRKPYEPEQIAHVLSEAARALSFAEPEIEIRVARKRVLLPFSQICYATAENHYVSVMTPSGEQRASLTFAELRQALSADPRFLLCNRGILINMDEVLKFEPGRVLMKDGASFPIRQRDKNGLFNTFTQYQFRHMRRER
ncbi:MAG: LytTR family DNA-binding domain-containing protein [Clostridia bacterium]|nr:LytTR family DNA-binding domain-containing protein [Clostridia bacterium]